MSSFVLVHGAWHGGWCWNKVVPLLRDHHVQTPDLPGHGKDTTPLAAITAEQYIEVVTSVVASMPEPVILVGHSFGGIVTSQVAERMPEQVRMLVYLAAFLTPPGMAFEEVVAHDRESLLHPQVVFDTALGICPVPEPEVATKAFYADCDPEDVAGAMSLLRPEPLVALEVPTDVTEERFGRVPRIYIECTADEALGLPTQRWMVSLRPCRRVFSLPSSHSPFFSMPEELAQVLLMIEQEVARCSSTLSITRSNLSR